MNPRESMARQVRQRAEKDLEELVAFLRFPTVSALSQHQEDLLQAAHWLESWLVEAGADDTALLETGSAPLAYATWQGVTKAPSLLVYGHYDVQPVDPLEAWDTPPFEATRKGDHLHARGVSDMKGQIYAFVKAMQILSRNKALGVTVKLILDGEEESLSPNLRQVLVKEKKRLSSHWMLNCDAGALGPCQPAVTYALRGIAYYEIEVKGPENDLHSGSFGGAVPNPAHLLCDLISGLHDEKRRITLPGFYDRVRELSLEDREALGQQNLTDEAFQEIAGVATLDGEEGYTTVERLGSRPCLDVNGMLCGYTDKGVKTILPGKAMAKLSFRLVPDQDPGEVEGQLRQYLEERIPKGISWTLRELMRGPWALTDPHSPPAQAAFQALRETFGVEPLPQRQGFSVPAVGHAKEILGVDSIMMGFMLPDDGIHGPNEKQHLPTLFLGAEAYLRFLLSLGDLDGRMNTP